MKFHNRKQYFMEVFLQQFTYFSISLIHNDNDLFVFLFHSTFFGTKFIHYGRNINNSYDAIMTESHLNMTDTFHWANTDDNNRGIWCIHKSP